MGINHNISKAATGLLIKILLATLPLYGMQTSKPPCLTLDELERLNREFSWEDKEDSKKIHTISWHHLQEYLGRGFGYQEDERYKPSVACKVELEDATIPATTVGTNTVAKVWESIY